MGETHAIRTGTENPIIELLKHKILLKLELNLILEFKNDHPFKLSILG